MRDRSASHSLTAGVRALALSAFVLGGWILAAGPAGAFDEEAIYGLGAERWLPSVDAAPPPLRSEPELLPIAATRPAVSGFRQPDYYSKEDRARDALQLKRRGKWRVFKHKLPAGAYEDELDLFFRTPTKKGKGTKQRMLSAGFEVRF